MTDRPTGLMRDLDEWQRWERSRRRATNAARQLKHRLRPGVPDPGELHLPSAGVRTLVVIEKFTPSCRAAIVEPLRHLEASTTAVLTPSGADIDDVLPGLTTTAFEGVEQLGADVSAVLSLGAYLGLSGPVAAWAREHDIPFFVVQHGLLTPSSPPASAGAHVLAWSDGDASYWSDGRPDLEVHVTGSQMLWEADRLPKVAAPDETPVMLGQLHGTELSRPEVMRTYWSACRDQGMAYRPHPNENDVVSRALHEVMRRGGITFDTRDVSLAQLERPVVSIFSTGTLEAAMRGLPAWVMDVDPSSWVREFWHRYGLREWGGEPTPAWKMPVQAPALAVAQAVQGVRA